MEWQPTDPRGESPKPGEPGHFDHHEWLKEFVLEAEREIELLKIRIAKLEE